MLHSFTLLGLSTCSKTCSLKQRLIFEQMQIPALHEMLWL